MVQTTQTTTCIYCGQPAADWCAYACDDCAEAINAGMAEEPDYENQ